MPTATRPRIDQAWVAAQVRDNLARILTPAVAQRVLIAIRQDRGDFAEFSRLIQTDPFIAAKIIGLANLVRRREDQVVRTADRAVQVLGLRHVEMLIVSVILAGSLQSMPRTRRRPDLTRWILACGVAGQWLGLAPGDPVPDPEAPPGDRLVHGLIQSLGVLILSAGLREAYDPVLLTPFNPINLLARERQTLGQDHHAVTLWALEAMRCPAEIAPFSAALAEARHDADALRGQNIEILAARIAGLQSRAADACLRLALPRLNRTHDQLDAHLPALRGQVRDLARALKVEIGPWPDAHEQARAAARDGADAIDSLLGQNLTLLDSIGVELLREAGTTQKVDQLQDDAATDPLTGALNRRGWDQRLARLDLPADRPVALVLADIDRFKSVNDQLGHAQGDRVLRCAADAFSLDAARLLLVARFGGDEFAALLDVGHRRGLSDLLSAVRHRFALSTAGQSLSLGALMTTPARLAADAEALYRRADDCLYIAKRGGRDRAVIEP